MQIKGLNNLQWETETCTGQRLYLLWRYRTKFYAWHFDITENLKFIAPRFTSFADHASLHVELQFSRWNSRNPHTVDTEIHTSRKFRWNPNNYDEAKCVLLSYLENLNFTSESVDVECQNTIHKAVEQVTLHLFKALKQKS